MQPYIDYHSLDNAVQGYFAAALAPSTHSTYKTAERRYLSFCSNFHITPLPTTEASLCYFVACLGQQGLAHSTIHTYLSGIRQFQIVHGYNDFNYEHMPQLCQILKGVKVSQGQKGRTTRPRLPITPCILRLLKRVWFPYETEPSYDNLMLWAASTTAFFGFCHSGEITTPSENSYDPSIHLSYGDIASDNPKCTSMLSINLKHSKTDQERKGMKIIIGKTGDDLCPISAMLNFLKVRGTHPGPLFCRKSGAPPIKIKICGLCKICFD